MTDSLSPDSSSGPRLPAKGDLILGKYRVDRVLGQGGMGVVIAAHHEALEQQVAIKLLSPQNIMQGESHARFFREARAAARLESAHVVRVLDVGALDGGAPYMVMEYLPGSDLSEELEKSGALPPAIAVDYVLQALDAIAEAHHKGIVHRDLKPANLFLVERSDGSRLVKVLDFGISKLETSGIADLSLTSSQSMMGSPLYMSPEQVRSAKHVDSRSDLWALGIILHELIAGNPPFKGESIGEVFASILQEPPPSLRSLRPELPEALGSLVLRCLEKEVSARFQTASEMAEALAPFASADSAPIVSRISAAHARRSGSLSSIPLVSAEVRAALSEATTLLGEADPPRSSSSASRALSPASLASFSPTADGDSSMPGLAAAGVRPSRPLRPALVAAITLGLAGLGWATIQALSGGTTAALDASKGLAVVTPAVSQPRSAEPVVSALPVVSAVPDQEATPTPAQAAPPATAQAPSSASGAAPSAIPTPPGPHAGASPHPKPKGVGLPPRLGVGLLDGRE